jgi:hypothetical protein
MTATQKIFLLFPTARPTVFRKTLECWKSTAKNLSNIQLIVGVDKVSDAQQLGDFEFVRVANSVRPGATWPTYCLSYDLEPHDNDIIILASDDFFPPQYWDQILQKELNNSKSLLLVKDGYQHDTADVVTIPIMTGYAFKLLNKIIYNPVYHHLFSDQELYYNAKELGLIKDIRKTKPDILFEHRHYAANKRERDDVDNALTLHEKQDKLLYLKRKQIPIATRNKYIPEKEILSILIPTLSSRKNTLDELLAVLKPQQNPYIEIIVHRDDKKTIGQKRNELIKNASGEYIVFIDDDDLVHPYYANIIIEAIRSQEKKPDCIGIVGLYTKKSTPDIAPKKFIHSIKYGAWFEENDIFYRPPNHLNPIRKEYAEKIIFKHINVGEDKDYSLKVKDLLQTEVLIDIPIYHYRGKD